MQHDMYVANVLFKPLEIHKKVKLEGPGQQQGHQLV